LDLLYNRYALCLALKQINARSNLRNADRRLDTVRKMKASISTTRGITFVELMATVVIIGLVSGMAVPRFQIAYERLQIRSANREIASTLRLARSMSVSNKDRYGVFFDQGALSISLFKNSASPETNEYTDSDSLIRVDTLPHAFTFMSGENTIVFQPSGSAGFDNEGYILTMSQTPDVVSFTILNVLASTGRVKILSQYF